MPLTVSDWLLTLLFLLVAALYASVGHAGASGYLAAMSLVGIPSSEMRPTALVLNLFVATIATVKFTRAGCFSWRLFWPFALTSIPMAFVGGSIQLPTAVFKQLVGLVLLFSAARLLFIGRAATAESETKHPSLLLSLIAGLILGLLAALTGTGGGIFLSPLLVLTWWATLRQASGVSAAFILVNSAAGLLGYCLRADATGSLLQRLGAQPVWGLWIIAVLIGGWLGAEWGSRRFQSLALRRLLAAVLIVAAAKLLMRA